MSGPSTFGDIYSDPLPDKEENCKQPAETTPEARSHKKVILDYYGLKHALKPASEAGVDLSNVPGTFVSLLPREPDMVAKDIARKLSEDPGLDVTVMIIDTDASYEIGGWKFTSLPQAVKGIKCDLGVFGYILGRFGNIIGPTPLGISKFCDLDEVLDIAHVAEDYHKKMRRMWKLFMTCRKCLKVILLV